MLDIFDYKELKDFTSSQMAEAVKQILTAIKESTKNIMLTQADLDAVIDGLEAAIETALEAALAPVIAAIQAKAGSVDLSAEIAKLNAVAGDVSAKVAADLTPA